MIILPPPSCEQEKVIKGLADGKNVMVDSVAGSGKTTCNMHIAKVFHDKNILLLTYNSRLKLETRIRAQKLEISNMVVHSYHSFCKAHYDLQNDGLVTDKEIQAVVDGKCIKTHDYAFEIILLDESQDIKQIYYTLICKITADNSVKRQSVQFCVLGDHKQSIYEFMGADCRYLTMADSLYGCMDRAWTKEILSTSYRITSQMAEFINTTMLHRNRLLAIKIAENKPEYFFYGFNQSPLFNKVYELIIKYGPENIFILAPSLRTIANGIREGQSRKNDIQYLENEIKKRLKHTDIHVPISDDETLDDDIIRGKLVFSTFHQAKGLERKAVVVFNFDESYTNFFNRKADKYVCPNELYVATTRAKECLVLLHNERNNFLPFLRLEKLPELVECNNIEFLMNKIKNEKRQQNNEYNTRNYAVTNLLRHVPENIISQCMNIIQYKQNHNFKVKNIRVNSTIKNPKTHNKENVSDITGTAIPTLLQLKLKNSIGYMNNLETFESNFINIMHAPCNVIQNMKISEIKKRLLQSDLPDSSDLLYISNCQNTIVSGYHYKYYQICEYNWLSKSALHQLYTRLTTLNISADAEFEVMINDQTNTGNESVILHGSVDCIDYKQKILYEFKVVDHIKDIHFIQLCLYMYLHKTKCKNDKQYNGNTKSNLDETEWLYVLYNIRSNEYFNLNCSLETCTSVFDILLKYKKNGIGGKCDDATFLETNKIFYLK